MLNMRYKIDRINTQWVFLLTGVKEPDNNQLQDINFGVGILLKMGIPAKNITLIIDGHNSTIENIIKNARKNDVTIYNSQDFNDVLLHTKRDFVVLAVYSHGEITGLEATPPIRPHRFISTIKAACSAKEVFILLGSCYSGIFEYPTIRLKHYLFTPEIVIIGASRFTKSYAMPSATYDAVTWDANLMFFAFFMAMLQKIDVDGDGHFSFMDVFKHMTYNIVQLCKEVEKMQRLNEMRTLMEYDVFWETIKHKSDAELTPEEKQKKEKMNRTLELDYTHQEPWILNAKPAIYTDICL